MEIRKRFIWIIVGPPPIRFSLFRPDRSLRKSMRGFDSLSLKKSENGCRFLVVDLLKGRQEERPDVKLRLCTVFILRLVVSVSPLCNLSHQERFRSSDSFRSMLMFPILHLMESVFQDSRPFPRKRLPYGLEVLSHGFSREFSCFFPGSV